MAKIVIVDTRDGSGAKEMYEIRHQNDMYEVSDSPRPSDRGGSTKIVFGSMVTQKNESSTNPDDNDDGYDDDGFSTTDGSPSTDAYDDFINSH